MSSPSSPEQEAALRTARQLSGAQGRQRNLAGRWSAPTAARRRDAPAVPAPAAAPVAVSRPSAKITTNSRFDHSHQVTIDPYGLNPLEEDARQNLRGIRMRGAAPRMFLGGSEDLPPFTASGLDPRLLLKLPYGLRHYAAAEPSMASVHAIFEQYADMPYARLDHQGLDEAIGRVSYWLFNQGSEGI